jgi:hypothetical protein
MSTRGMMPKKSSTLSGSREMTAVTASVALPTRIVRPTAAPMRETSGAPTHTVPGAGEPSASRSGAAGASATRMRPRSG